MRRFTYSLLTDLHIWDPTIDELIRAFPGFRFLRYKTRGYESSSNELVDVDVLADDLAGAVGFFGECRVVLLRLEFLWEGSLAQISQ